MCVFQLIKLVIFLMFLIVVAKSCLCTLQSVALFLRVVGCALSDNSGFLIFPG